MDAQKTFNLHVLLWYIMQGDVINDTSQKQNLFVLF